MSYQPTLTPETCYKKLFEVSFSMVNLDLKSINEKMAKGQTPFKKLVRCNMGNPPAVGQKENTFVRQVIACTVYPELMNKDFIPSDVKERAKRLMADMPGKNSGSYQATEGIQACRVDAAKYVSERDGYEASPSSFYFCNGATEGIQAILRPIIRGEYDAVLTPSPGFPMYNAQIEYYEGKEICYYLDETHDWAITEKCLKTAVAECQEKGLTPRCLVIINPGNPTGGVQLEKNLEMTLKFAYSHNMCVIADEVYQHNIYEPDRFPFVSTRKVLKQLEEKGECKGLELFSINSASKSMYGECGRRGAYWQTENINPKVISQLLDIISLGATNTDGMVAMDCIVNPPKPGEPSYDTWNKEYNMILKALQEKARMVAKEMHTWKGMHCSVPAGALYVYPQILAPKKAEEAAAKIGKKADQLYCQDLLEAVGVICLPGTMLGQYPGTYHLRMTILPDQEEMREMLARWKVFHESWIQKYE